MADMLILLAAALCYIAWFVLILLGYYRHYAIHLLGIAGITLNIIYAIVAAQLKRRE